MNLTKVRSCFSTVASKLDIYAAGTIPCNKEEANGDDARPLKFVNISRPTGHVRGAKKSLGSYASQKLQRMKRGSGKSMNRAGATVYKNTLQSNRSSSASEPQSLHRPPSARLDSFATFPVTMKPYMDALLHRCKRSPRTSIASESSHTVYFHQTLPSSPAYRSPQRQHKNGFPSP